MKAVDILSTARDLVGEDREKQHGNKRQNFINIARLWRGYLAGKEFDIVITPEDVCSMMELLKIARRMTGEFNVDDYIDAAGYAAIAAEVSDDHNI